VPNFPSATRWTRRLSLTTRFGLLSGALVGLLGIGLGVWSATHIRSSNIDEAVRLIDFAKATTTSTLSQLSKADIPQRARVENEVGRMIVEATLQSKRLVAVVVWNRPDRVGYISKPLNQAPKRPAGLTSVFEGRTTTALISSAEARNDPALAGLVQTTGPVLQILTPVRFMPDDPVAVLQAFVPWRPVQHNISTQLATTVLALLGGLIVFWLALFRLVTRASRRLREQAERNRELADHDSLTGLANRELLQRETAEAIRRARRTGKRLGLVLFDLDRFKEINDTLGHHHGDLLLQEIGPRLSRVLREGDVVARLGGDEYAILLPSLSGTAHAQSLGRRLRAELAAPFVLEGISIDVEASMGIALMPDHGVEFAALLQHADVAMYIAKRTHLGVAIYDPTLDEHTHSRLALIAELRAALADPEQFVVHYQPKADMQTGALTGLEALVRWQHPTRGLLAPDEFIPAAERTGMIRPLTDLVLSKAVRQSKAWKEAGLTTAVAVNLSTRCLLDPQLPDDVGALLAANGLAGSELDLEITESAIMADPERAEEILTRLGALGIGIAIDDFGTGYSSMATLKRLPVQQIKIDKSFVIDLVDDATADARDRSSDVAIVRSMVELGRTLGLGVVAEGVESAATWDQLTELGCTTGQGYYLSRPLPVEEVLPWLRRRAHQQAATRLPRQLTRQAASDLSVEQPSP
jgi:diguanylate cyclase (GGDEF)-like protein